MSRPRLVTQKQIRAAWASSKPDVKRFAVVLGVSERTAYRYLETIGLREHKCPSCDGKGYLWK